VITQIEEVGSFQKWWTTPYMKPGKQNVLVPSNEKDQRFENILARIWDSGDLLPEFNFGFVQGQQTCAKTYSHSQRVTELNPAKN
jgi:hypothetical protein